VWLALVAYLLCKVVLFYTLYYTSSVLAPAELNHRLSGQELLEIVYALQVRGAHWLEGAPNVELITDYRACIHLQTRPILFRSRRRLGGWSSCQVDIIDQVRQRLFESGRTNNPQPAAAWPSNPQHGHMCWDFQACVVCNGLSTEMVKGVDSWCWSSTPATAFSSSSEVMKRADLVDASKNHPSDADVQQNATTSKNLTGPTPAPFSSQEFGGKKSNED